MNNNHWIKIWVEHICMLIVQIKKEEVNLGWELKIWFHRRDEI